MDREQTTTKLPPEAYENDFFPGWEVSKRSYPAEEVRSCR